MGSLALQAKAATLQGDGASQAIRGPRELLAMLGVEEADWKRWQDDRPVAPEEIEQLLGLFYRFSRFHPAEWELWRTDEHSFVSASQNIAKERGTVLALPGIVEDVARWDVDAGLLERFEIEHVFRVRVRVTGSTPTGTVDFVTPRIPNRWVASAKAARGQPVEVVGLLLKREPKQAADEAAPLLVAGPRVEWYPSSSNANLAIQPDQLPLFAAGFSAALLDDARSTNGRGLGQSDRECFLSLLRAASRLESTQPADKSPSLFDILKKPNDWIGRRVRLRGRSRRIARIEITDVRDRARLGFDAYYQIDMFVDLAGARIEIQPPPEASAQGREPVTLSNVYPVTLCVVELPAPLKEAIGSAPSANVREPIEVDGYFMKLWSYYSPLVAEFGTESRQAVPLVMATEIRRRAATRVGVGLGVWAMLLICGLIGGVWIWLWRSNRADARARRFRRERRDRS